MPTQHLILYCICYYNFFVITLSPRKYSARALKCKKNSWKHFSQKIICKTCKFICNDKRNGFFKRLFLILLTDLLLNFFNFRALWPIGFLREKAKFIYILVFSFYNAGYYVKKDLFLAIQNQYKKTCSLCILVKKIQKCNYSGCIQVARVEK